LSRKKTKTAFAIITAILTLLLLPLNASADRIISNSEDWRDVYSTLLYANILKQPSNFLVSDRHATLLLNSIPRGTKLQVVSSSRVPYIVGYKSFLENRGYPSDELIFDSANLELAKRLNVTRFIVIDDSYGYNAISVAPYAVVSNSYVLFADRNNIDEVYSFLKNRKVDSIIIYGNVDREVINQLTEFNPEIINKDGDRYDNNIEIVKKYQEIKHAKQAVLTNGEFIEAEIMSGVEPVIFIGSQNVPEQVKKYIQESGLEVGVLIGNQYVGTATNIRRQTGLSVFVKFAQSARVPRGPISPVEGLDLFYLPVINIVLDIFSIEYNRATNTLEVTIKNNADQAAFFKGTYTIEDSSGKKFKVGDTTPIFIDGKEFKTVTYEIEPLTGNITADVYVIYGESKRSLEKVIDKKVNVSTVSIIDESLVDILSLKYDKRRKVFLVEVKNIGKTEAYVDIELVDVIVASVRHTFGLEDVARLKKGQIKTLKIRAELEDEDIEANPKVLVRGYYGQRKQNLIKTIEKEFVLELKGVDYLFYASVIASVVLLFLIIITAKRKRKKEEKK